MARKNRKQSKSARKKAEQHARAQSRRKAANAAGASGTSQKSCTQSVPPDLAKVGTFLADLRKEKTAQLLAEKDLSIIDIAAAVGVSRECIRLWQQEAEFAARVADHTAMLADLSQRFLIGRKAYRLGNLQERLLRMQRVMDARAADPELQKAGGGDAGLFVRRLRMIGSGENAMVVEEFEFDAALDKAMRDTEKQAAQECGQWAEKKEVSGAGGGPLLLQIIEEVADDDADSGKSTEGGSADGTPPSGSEDVSAE